MSFVQRRSFEEPEKKSKSSTWIIIIIIVVVVLIIGGILLWWFVLRNRSSTPSTQCTTNADCTSPLICGPSGTCIADTSGGNGGGGTNGCTTNADCTAPTDVCDVDGNCVECLLDTQCETNEECVNKQCVPCTPPNSPTMLTAAMAGFNLFSATWTAVSNATSYVVRYESITFGEWVEFCTINTFLTAESTTCASQGAPANTPCWICPNAQAKVKAITPCGETAFSIPLAVLNPNCC